MKLALNFTVLAQDSALEWKIVAKCNHVPAAKVIADYYNKLGVWKSVQVWERFSSEKRRKCHYVL